jgi:hypothetical protein
MCQKICDIQLPRQLVGNETGYTVRPIHRSKSQEYETEPYPIVTLHWAYTKTSDSVSPHLLQLNQVLRNTK